MSSIPPQKPSSLAVPSEQPGEVDRMRAYLSRVASGPSDIGQSPVYLGKRSLSELYMMREVQEVQEVTAPGYPKSLPISSWNTVYDMAERQPSCWRAILLGDSGDGKSTLLHMTASQMAQAAIDRLDAGASLADISIPICLKMEDLVNAFPWRHNEPFPALCKALRATLLWQFAIGHDERLANQLAELACEHRTWLLLRVSDSQSLQKLLFAIEGCSCRVIITSHNYARGLVPPRFANTYQLLPFSDTQTWEFIRRWFTASPEHTRVLEILRLNPVMERMATNPLVLSLLCWNAEHPKIDQGVVTRTQLYDGLLRNLLALPDAGSLVLREDRFTAWRRFLADLALMLKEEDQTSVADNRLKEMLGLSKNRPSLAKVDREKNPCIRDLEKCELLVEELCTKGLLRPLGSNPPAYAFIPDSVVDFLAAWKLADKLKYPPEHRVELQLALEFVDRKAWLPKWKGVILFLAGLMEDPRPLLERLADNSKDDKYCHRLRIAANCLGELSALTQSNITNTIDKITDASISQSKNNHALLEEFFQANWRYKGITIHDWLAREYSGSDSPVSILPNAYFRNGGTSEAVDWYLRFLQSRPFGAQIAAIYLLLKSSWTADFQRLIFDALSTETMRDTAIKVIVSQLDPTDELEDRRRTWDRKALTRTFRVIEDRFL